MVTVIDRLKMWRDLMHSEYISEEPHVLAGREAEEFLYTLVETNLKHKGAYCFLGKRVQSGQKRRRYEIDLIVLTKKQLHFIEVKNWSGELSQVGETWIQRKRSGQRIEHPNLLEYNSQKRDAVIEYLQRNGLNLDITYFTNKVIFMNEKLRISPEILQNPDIVPALMLEKYLVTQEGLSSSERFVHSVIELCLDSEKSFLILDGLFHAMSSDYYVKAKESLSALETWDKVVLHGGRILSGDALKLFVDEKIIDVKNLPSGIQCPIKWNRSKVLSLFQSLLFSYPLGHIRLPNGNIAIKPNDILKFHAVGDKKPMEIPMKNINMIIRG